MEVIFSKARAFQLLDAFEHDLRLAIEEYLLDHLAVEEVLGSDYELAESRRAADESSESISIVHYLYLRQAFDILMRYSAVLPRDLGDELSRNVSAMDRLVAIRNRVMHGRPLHSDDLESAQSLIGLFASRYFQLTRQMLSRLERDTRWEPPFTSIPKPVEKVLHNLPLADHEETGLVGRGKDVSDVTALLLKGRDRMITITGEGGIGKTALALQVAYQMVDAPEPFFDAVLWVSLKHELLTAAGVRSITDALRDVAGATEALGRVLDPSFRGSLDELADHLSGLRCLVVLDNLESAQGSEVLDLYDALPESVTFLFTSRVGIGQVERRFALGELAIGDAVLLFKKFSGRRRQYDLAAKPVDEIHAYVTNLRMSPLAIRWFILSVEAGKMPEDTLRHQGELLRFCVDNVYEALSSDSKLVLAILRSLDRPISFDELAVVSALAVDTLRRSAQDLFQGSLLTRTPSPDGDKLDLLELSMTARAYLPRADHNSTLMNQVLARESAYIHDREEHRRELQNRQLDANVIRLRNDLDEPTAHLLRLALRLSADADWDGAEAYVERARSLNPGFFEIDRVGAFIASKSGDAARAAALYRSAMADCESPDHKATVAHFYAGHLARVMHDIPAAIELERFAHETLRNSDTSFALGNFLVWDKTYAEGQEYLEEALDTSSHKLARIVTTALVDSWRRWAEDELFEKRPAVALDKALAGFYCAKPLIDSGSRDARLVSGAVRAAAVALRSLSKLETDAKRDDVARAKSALASVVEHEGLFRRSEEWPRLVAAMQGRGTAALDSSGDIAKLLGEPTRQRVPVSTEQSVVVRRGRVLSYKGTYGFISHPEIPDNVFFHAGALTSSLEDSGPSAGQLVEFVLDEDAQGRFRAREVTPVS